MQLWMCHALSPTMGVAYLIISVYHFKFGKMFWNVSIKQIIWLCMRSTFSVISKLFPSMFSHIPWQRGWGIRLWEKLRSSGSDTVGTTQGGVTVYTTINEKTTKMRTRALGWLKYLKDRSFQIMTSKILISSFKTEMSL